jgi:GAF domain-containing protein
MADPLLAQSAVDPLNNAAWVLRDHPALACLGAAAYANFPLTTTDNHTAGAICVIDVPPRRWSHGQMAHLSLLADIVRDQLELQDHERAVTLHRIWKGVAEPQRW